MLYNAVLFFFVALVPAVFGFGGIAAGAAGIAQFLFFAFLVIAVVTLLMSLLRKDRVTDFKERSEPMARTSGKARTTMPFLSDVRTLRKRARQHIEEGAV